MSSRREYRFAQFVAAIVILAIPGAAQSVISTHSGLIHFFEGQVYVGDQALEAHLGKFPSVPQGGELRTGDGRAEVLLTPGVFLRMGERSAIRMVENALADTQVELESGSIAIEAGPLNLNTSVTALYKEWRVHLLNQGVYRIDSDPPRLWVGQGKAEVFATGNAAPVVVDKGMTLPFAAVLVPEQGSEPNRDSLTNWSNGRNESISADNAITAQLDEDPNSAMAGLSGFTYFPVLGVPPASLSATSPYGYYPPAQPGFHSVYLPGYNYLPLVVGLGYGGYGRLGGLGLGRTVIGAGPIGVSPVGRPYYSYPAGAPRFGNPPVGGVVGLRPPLAGTPGLRPGVAPVRAPVVGVHGLAHH
jgi:hypothetical protein